MLRDPTGPSSDQPSTRDDDDLAHLFGLVEQDGGGERPPACLGLVLVALHFDDDPRAVLVLEHDVGTNLLGIGEPHRRIDARERQGHGTAEESLHEE